MVEVSSSLDQQILDEFSEIVEIISAKVMETAVTPAFRDGVKHWSDEAKASIDRLERLLDKNAVVLGNLVKNTADPINATLQMLQSEKADFQELIAETKNLETSLNTLSETGAIPERLKEIGESLKRLSALQKQLENRSGEYQKILLEQKREIVDLQNAFSKKADELIAENKTANLAMLEAIKSLQQTNYSLQKEVTKLAQSMPRALKAIETSLTLETAKLNESLANSLANIEQELTTSLEKGQKAWSLLQVNVDILSDELKTEQKRRSQIENESEEREKRLLKKIDALTIAVTITGAASLTLLLWLLFSLKI